MPSIVSIVWYKILPPVFGGQKGIAGFNEALAKHFPLACICSHNNEPIEPMGYSVTARLPISKTQFFNPLCWWRIARFIRKQNAKFAILEHPYHGLASCFFGGARLIVHSHNIEANRFRAMGKWWWWLLRPYERWVHRRAELSLFKTNEDREWSIEHFALSRDRCLLVHYGIERPANPYRREEVRREYGVGDDERLLLFAGTLDYPPNEEAVEYILNQLMPLLDKANVNYRIVVCGRAAKKRIEEWKSRSPRILFHGEVDHLAALYAAADAFINPVTLASGVQTKTIDAIAAGCNVISFEQMINGIPPDVCGHKLLLAKKDDWDNFVTLIEQACGDRSETPEVFFEWFSWQRIIQPLVDRISEMDKSL